MCPNSIALCAAGASHGQDAAGLKSEDGDGTYLPAVSAEDANVEARSCVCACVNHLIMLSSPVVSSAAKRCLSLSARQPQLSKSLCQRKRHRGRGAHKKRI